MSNISSTDTRSVKLIRRVARFLSIPWALLVLILSMANCGYATEEGQDITISVYTFIIIALMGLGGVLISTIWGKEAIGGGLLIAAGVLFLGQDIYDIYIYNPYGLQLGWFNVVMILTPLVAGSLFLACHQKSKTSGEQPVPEA